MSDTVDSSGTQSPDSLETHGTGMRRVNRLPIVLGGALVAMALGSVVYTGTLRSSLKKAEAASAENEKYRIPTAAVPPVTRPPGPDVALASAPVYVSQTQGQIPSGPVQESETAKRAREKKIEEYEAALRADISVPIFNGDQMQQQQQVQQIAAPNTPPMMLPPPPQSQGDDGMGGGANPVRNHAGFGANDNSSIYLPHTRQAALSPNEIKAGSIIPGVMISGINSDLPGQIIGQVRQDVYDSATGFHLLIPAGAKLVGSYDSNVVAGEERVLIVWNRIIFPDSSSITLNNMPGADQGGYAGFHDQVDNHYWRTFGNALMLSVLTAAMQIGQQPRGSANGQLSATQIAAAASAMQFGQIGMQSARRGLNTPPTMVIRPGFLFNIMITKDMILPNWKGHPAAQKTAVQEVEE